MKRFATIIILALMATAGRADNLRTLFITMPDSITPTLTKSDRLDFLDYMDSGMKARVRNKLGGESVMTRFDENMLSIQTSQSGRMDMLLLKRGKDENLICIIRTVNAKYEDSRLSFFTEDWKSVPADELIELPVIDDYLTKEALKNDSLDYFKKMSMLRLQSIVPADGALEFRYTSLDDLGEDADKYRSWIKPTPIRYTWNGKTFKRK